ncbi:Crp/Fnr family transcriptional regulator [Algoriphagus sp. AK58]|uniref:Crp/Fnr family transcriptional regulator n=1 Tax=Algoriphagus sp. AK58 TaxID=1406877 RepID=UPI00164FEB10|nr:Crp/Fnr family transcriptional regulator [Algoriphagus sp. AK58]MBC6367996.1 cyclic nucleotide-binding protein [Algoriphagus sp. AK58]
MNPIKPLLIFLHHLHPISTETEADLLGLCRLKTYGKNEEIQAIGATCRTIYFMVSGVGRIYYLKDGKEVTEYFAFPNDLIVRAESLFTQLPSKKAIQALEDSEVVAIPADPLFKLFEKHHDLERLFRLLVQNAYVETLRRLENIQFLTAEERYEKLIDEKPELIQKIPLKHVASFLGITQVSLSRIRGQKR